MWNYKSLTNLNEIHDWGEQKAALALSHRGTPKVPHPPTKKMKMFITINYHMYKNSINIIVLGSSIFNVFQYLFPMIFQFVWVAVSLEKGPKF